MAKADTMPFTIKKVVGPLSMKCIPGILEKGIESDNHGKKQDRRHDGQSRSQCHAGNNRWDEQGLP